MSWTQNVYSSMVSEVAYDSDTNELIVTWAKSGKRSAYSGVPEDLAREVANAPSVGTIINSDVKGVYPHRYI
jgi:hypothetical protein